MTGSADTGAFFDAACNSFSRGLSFLRPIGCVSEVTLWLLYLV